MEAKKKKISEKKTIFMIVSLFGMRVFAHQQKLTFPLNPYRVSSSLTTTSSGISIITEKRRLFESTFASRPKLRT